MEYPEITLDIEYYPNVTKDGWAQAKYLVHGYDDVFWTNNLDDAIDYLKQCFEELEENKIL